MPFREDGADPQERRSAKAITDFGEASGSKGNFGKQGPEGQTLNDVLVILSHMNLIKE